MLRTYRINFQKNWSLQPSKWNAFLSNLEGDIKDLFAEIDGQTFSVNNIFTTLDATRQKAFPFARKNYPKL